MNVGGWLGKYNCQSYDTIYIIIYRIMIGHLLIAITYPYCLFYSSSLTNAHWQAVNRFEKRTTLKIKTYCH